MSAYTSSNDIIHKIILTGFKSCDKNNIDISEAIVYLVKLLGVYEEVGIELKTVIFDYDYLTSLPRALQIWNEEQPFLVVHIGMNDSNEIQIETRARQYGYSKPDRNSICPALLACTFGDDFIVHSKINISDILKKDSMENYKIRESLDGGWTLNEYVYYISLSNDPRKAISITLPRKDGSEKLLEKALIIRDILAEIYVERLSMPDEPWKNNKEDLEETI